MQNYMIVYLNGSFPTPEPFYFKCEEGDLPEELEEGKTFFYDDADEDEINSVDEFITKVGIQNFEGGESITLFAIHEHLFTEVKGEMEEDDLCPDCKTELISVGNKVECPNCGKFF